MKKILYNLEDGLYMRTPNKFIEDELANAHLIAEKDVPAGVLYKLYQDTDLPDESVYPYETWICEITESNADGRGLTKEEFYAKYPDLIGWAVQ